MKQLGKRTDIEKLCVLHERNADQKRTGYFREYIAFGDWTDSNEGPSVRFHGGTPFSGRLENAPVMHFNIYGDCQLVQAMWMNPNTCPNVFNEQYLRQLTAFVQTNLPILYLVYERYLDKEDAIAYFEGKTEWETMLSSVYRIAEDLYAGLLSCDNSAQLHMFCVHEQIYGKSEANGNRQLLCNRLEKQLHPVFELSWEGENCKLSKYNGNSETVYIPEDVDTIGENAFCGNRKIKKIIFPNTVQSIEKAAFSGCSEIEVLLLPPDMRGIFKDAFAECVQLRTVCFEQPNPNELFIEEGAFRGCTRLREIVLPRLTIPEGNPFSACPNLYKIQVNDMPRYTQEGREINGIVYRNILWVGCNGTAIPEETECIDSGAFADCPGLRELFIPSSVVTIYEDSFLRCPNLVICCKERSFAQKYAKEYNIPYNCMD